MPSVGPVGTLEQPRPGGRVDGAVDAAATEQREFAALTMASTRCWVRSPEHSLDRGRHTARVCGPATLPNLAISGQGRLSNKKFGPGSGVVRRLSRLGCEGGPQPLNLARLGRT